MLWHHHITHQPEIKALPNFVENLRQKITRVCGGQQRLASVATAGDEVLVAQAIEAFQTIFS